MNTTENILECLRNIAKKIENDGVAITFPSLSMPGDISIIQTLDTIKQGGTVTPDSLANIIHYIADMMEA